MLSIQLCPGLVAATSLYIVLYINDENGLCSDEMPARKPAKNFKLYLNRKTVTRKQTRKDKNPNKLNQAMM